MLNIYIFYAKVINKIFRKCLNFLIIAINNNNNKTINEFKNFINNKNIVDIDKHIKCIQLIK